MKTPPFRREDLAPGACLCDHCIGKCCRYFSLPFPTPLNRDDYETVRLYLAHGQTTVYVEKGTWFLVIMTRCKYLTADNRCAVYLNRPKICQEYTTAECEYDSDWIFDKVFETPEQLAEYAECVLPRRPGTPRMDETPSPVPQAFTLPLETPLTWDDFDAIRWYLAHGQTFLYIAEDTWYLEVALRPQSRAHPAPARADGPFEKVFETPEQLWEYAEAVLPPRRRRRRSGPSLPIITTG